MLCVTDVLQKLVPLCSEGKSALEICQTGDSSILQHLEGVFTKKVDGKPISKGIAFPTCVNVNNTICHYSPLKSDPVVLLKAGDLVKMYVFFPPVHCRVAFLDLSIKIFIAKITLKTQVCMILSLGFPPFFGNIRFF